MVFGPLITTIITINETIILNLNIGLCQYNIFQNIVLNRENVDVNVLYTALMGLYKAAIQIACRDMDDFFK